MEIILASQDIRELAIGLIEDGRLVKEVMSSVAPEDHLSTVASTLNDWGVTVGDLERVIVVTGPGSFTASRVSVGLANVLAFTQEIPVVGVENPDRRSLTEIVGSLGEIEASNGFVMASYDRPPHTT